MFNVFFGVLPGFIEFNWFGMDVDWFLLGFTEFYRFLLELTKFDRVFFILPVGPTAFHSMALVWSNSNLFFYKDRLFFLLVFRLVLSQWLANASGLGLQR